MCCEMTALTLLDEWWGAGACRDAEPELFFPISAHGGAGSDIRRAKLICAACPVRSECLNYALRHRQEQGIWGGLTDEERRLLRRRLAANGRHSLTPTGVR
jgi:WhiB family redox-sensing transcriptional regulator